MKKVIRNKCFETNSSSMHSIVITKNDKVLTKDDIEDTLWSDNTIHIYSETDLDFGRSPFQVISDLKEKCAYAIASYCGWKPRVYCESFVHDLENIIRKAYPDFKGFTLPTEYEDIFYDKDGNKLEARNVYQNYSYQKEDDDCGFEYYYYDGDTKKEAVYSGEDEEVRLYGGVDHQSDGLLQGFLKDKNISLEEFILNRKYVVIIDGDEYCEFNNLIENGIVNINDLEGIYPCHENEMISYDSKEFYDRLDAGEVTETE